MDHVTDIIYFGAIKRCTKCNDGNFIFDNSVYFCNGNLTEWAECDNVVKEPERVPVEIPEHIKEEFPFLAKRFNVKTRILKDIPAAIQAKLKVKKEEPDFDA